MYVPCFAHKILPLGVDSASFAFTLLVAWIDGWVRSRTSETAKQRLRCYSLKYLRHSLGHY